MSSLDQTIAAFLSQVVHAYDGAFLGVGIGLLAAKTLFDYRSNSGALDKVKKAPHLYPSDLRAVLDKVEAGGGGALLVVVRGQVQPKSSIDSNWFAAKSEPLVSVNSGLKAVIVEQIQTCLYYDWHGFFDWMLSFPKSMGSFRKQYQTKSKRSIPFVITDGGSWPAQAFVVMNMEGSKHPLPLTTVHHHLQPVQPTPFAFLQAMFGYGCPVGILDEEKILPVEKNVTAIGICSSHDGVPEIKSSDEIPYFLSDMSKDQIVNEMDLKGKFLLGFGIVFGITSLGILGYSAFKNWNRWKAWRNRRQEQEILMQEEAEHRVQVEEAESQDVGDGQLCVCCLRRRRRSAFVPCGHLVCCSRCAMVIERDTDPLCPICRQSVSSSVRVYDS